MTGTLYIIATPIGNLEDISLRALRILKEVDIILAEDTRVTARLLSRYEIKTDIQSYHQHSSDAKKSGILGYLLAGKNIALVTDAGTPGISDPGNELISYLIERDINIRIVPVPGPSALTAALSVSGFRCGKFVFLGFLPKKGRTKLFNWVKEGKITFAFYESPYRILKSLDAISEYFSKDAKVAVARELTKMHESLYRGTAEEVKEKLGKGRIKGEITVVVEAV
jgi:16S rRNA (cytidine1402-2'-O)-methyltransferase